VVKLPSVPGGWGRRPAAACRRQPAGGGVRVRGMGKAAIGGLVASALLLGACGGSGDGGVQRIHAVAPAVTYSYQGDQLDQATDKANEYCGGYGQKAKLRDLSTQGGQHFASFDCR